MRRNWLHCMGLPLLTYDVNSAWASKNKKTKNQNTATQIWLTADLKLTLALTQSQWQKTFMICHKQINQGSLIRCLRSIQEDIHSRQGCYLLLSRRSLSEVTESSCCNHSKSQRLAERYKDTCGEQSPSPGHCLFWQFSMWLQNKM